MTKALLSASLLVWAAIPAPAQEAVAEPEFEAASIKPAEPLNTGSMTSGGQIRIRMGCDRPDPGRFTCSGMPLRALVVRAYGVKNYQVSEPGWMDSERFDVVAKVPPGATPEQFDRMLQKLLTDRFRMTVHHETRELPVYALVVGKGGHKLRKSVEDGKESQVNAALADRGALPPPPPPGGTGQQSVMVMSGGGAGAKGGLMMTMRDGLSEVVGGKVTLSSLASLLSTQLNRPVVDETGLTGDYDFTLDFAPDETMRPGASSGALVLSVPGPVAGSGGGGAAGSEPRDPSTAPSIFSAIQSQLGLKLEPKKGAVDMIVVDRAEKAPSGN